MAFLPVFSSSRHCLSTMTWPLSSNRKYSSITISMLPQRGLQGTNAQGHDAEIRQCDHFKIRQCDHANELNALLQQLSSCFCITHVGPHKLADKQHIA